MKKQIFLLISLILLAVQGMVADIYNGTFSVNPSSLTFSNQIVGTSSSPQQFTVEHSTQNDISIAFDNPSQMYDLKKVGDREMSYYIEGNYYHYYLSTWEVTYKPTATGSHSAKVTITQDGILWDKTKTVTINGNAVVPSVSTNGTSSMTFSNKTVGKTYTAPFRLTGSNLTGDLTLKVTGATGVFSINKTSITKSEAESGACSVVVTYKPTSAGTHTATITISGGGLKTNKTISLTGSAKVRKITSSATSLAFGNKKLNTSTKKTFTVKGTNLSAPLTLTLTGANNGMFKIDKTSITASQAASGVTVTVTYTPTSVGNHTAKITISSGDVDSKTVNLTGKGVKNSGGITPQPFTFEDLESLTITDFDVVSRLDSDFAMNIKPGCGVDNGNDDVLMAPSNPSTSVNELEMNSKIYADRLNIIIESPVEQKAVISDIAGHIREVNLQAGRNEIPVNASGIYIVRIREKSTKLMLK